MLSQFAATVTSGHIDNRVRDRVTGIIRFSGVTAPLCLDLNGNCLRDIAGCLLDFECDPPTQDCDFTPPSGIHTGFVGEMTASRRLVLPGPFSDESNCLYLEWFDRDGNRTALLKPGARCQISTPEWRMTEIEELEQKGLRWNCLRNQGPDREDDWFEMAGILGVAPPNLDESEWEALLQEADEEVERLTQLFDQSDADPEWHGPLSRAIGWAEVDPNGDRIDADSVLDPPMTSQPALNALAAGATSLLTYLVARVPPNATPANPFNRMLSRVTRFSAILETARESIDTMQDGDQMLLIVQIRRALTGIHGSAEFLDTLLADRQFNPEEHEPLRTRLFALREDALNTMSHLRRN